MSSSRQNASRVGSDRTRAVKGRRASDPSPWDVMVRLYNQEQSAALEADWDGGIRASVGRTFDRLDRRFSNPMSSTKSHSGLKGKRVASPVCTDK